MKKQKKTNGLDRELNLLEFLVKLVSSINLSGTLQCKITALVRDAYTYRFNKPRKPGWTRRRSRPMYKVTVLRGPVCDKSSTESRRYVRRRRDRYVSSIVTCVLRTSSSNRLARPRSWLRYRRSFRSHAGHVRSLDGSYSRSVKSIESACARNHARIITLSPIAPWHFPSRATVVGSKLWKSERYVDEHRLSIIRTS